jgi:hypothetical protein
MSDTSTAPLGIAELAARAGVTPRTVRYSQSIFGAWS